MIVGNDGIVYDSLVFVGHHLSHPDAGQFVPVAETIAVTHAQQQLAQFLQTHGRIIDRMTPELGAFLNEHLTCLNMTTSWTPNLGDIWLAQREERVTPSDLAARWGLLLMGSGTAIAEWSVRLSRVTQLLFDGRIVGTGDRIEARCNGPRALLHVTGGRDGASEAVEGIKLERRYGRWIVEGETVELQGTADLFGLTLASDLPHAFLTDIQSDAADVIDASMRTSVADGIDYLRAGSAAYFQWCTCVLRRLLALKADPKHSKRNKSGSRSDFPGLVHMSMSHDRFVIAENLVHEASHQYYHLALLLGPVVTGADRNLYYSPAVGRVRPLDRLIIAFHAFGNVALFCDQLRRVRTSFDNEIASRLERLSFTLELLRRPMVGNPTLTAMGRSFVAALDAELASRGVLREGLL